MQQLAARLPGADVRPVRQIMEGEANVLSKTRATLYAAAVLDILTAALCVLATLMGWVFDRRRDFAIMKALGASEWLIDAFFAAEAAALGVVRALPRIRCSASASPPGSDAPIFTRPLCRALAYFPYVLAGSMVVALISAILPIGIAAPRSASYYLEGRIDQP